MRRVAFRITVGIILCGIIPTVTVRWIIDNLEISWIHIFMVSGGESLWVYLCWDISRWIKEAWDARND